MWTYFSKLAVNISPSYKLPLIICYKKQSIVSHLKTAYYFIQNGNYWL